MKRVANGRVILICCLLFAAVGFPIAMNGQVKNTYYLDDMVEQLAQDLDEEEVSLESYVEELSDLVQQPINLNRTSKEQLELIPFLTAAQVENILYYLYAYGPMQTIYELQLVQDIDRQTIEYLLPFVYVGEGKEDHSFPSVKQLFNYGKHEVITRLDVPFYKRAGYMEYPDSVLADNPNKQYLGSPMYHSLRYRFKYKERLNLGVTAEKDAGEPFFGKGNKKGYDHYSFYLLIRELGRIKTLALGNYKLSFGMGLVMNSGFSMGKSSSIASIGYRIGGIRQHSSTDEYNYFRGLALSLALSKRCTLSAFYSHRDVDAIIEDGQITSLKKDGMHRILRDFERKNEAYMQVAGGNMAFQSRNLRLGMTVVHTMFSKPLMSEVQPYSLFHPRGKSFSNASIDYRYRWRQLSFFGETAVDGNGHIALFNALRFTPASGYQVLFLQRYYARDYVAIHAQSVSENSDVRNENGWYIGVEASPIKHWKFTAYADCFRFPWLKYGVDAPSSGFDGLVQATYTPHTHLSVFVRYRYKVKDKNARDVQTEIERVLPQEQHRLRWQLNYSPHDRLSLRTTIDLTSVHIQGQGRDGGFMLNQTLAYSFNQLPLRMDVNYGLFDTDSYNARLSIYEKGLLYAFSIPSFYGKGSRMTLNTRYAVSKRFIVSAKVAQTLYYDRDEMGSALEKIEGCRKVDLYMQLQYKF